MSDDHPGLPFVQAEGYTRGRPDGPPLWVVWHDMEASEHSARAESTAAYFANPSDGRQVSAHYCADDTSVVQCVGLDDSAWTVGNRPGNNRGINWELSGFARQTRAEWLDPFGVAMFAQVAPICASDMHRFGIPNRWCTVADLTAFRPGLTTHNDLRLAFGVTTHTDPGAGFPRDYVGQVLAAALNPQMEGDVPKFFLLAADATDSGSAAITGGNPTASYRTISTWPQVLALAAEWGLSAKVGTWPRHTTAEAENLYGAPKTAGSGGGLTYEQAVAAAREGAEQAEDS